MPSVDNSWSSTSLVPTQQQRYLWKFEYIYYSDGSVEVTDPVNLSIAGADADTSGVTDAINKNNQAIEEAKQQLETVRNDSLAAVEEAKQQLTTVADDLNTAKQDFQNAVSAVDTKATNLKNDLTQAKQDLASQAQQLQEQATAQSELTNRVSAVEETANGTKTTVSELSKTVDQNGKNITSVTARTKVVEDDLSGTKTTLSQVKTTADSTSQKTATLETGLNGLNAKFSNLKIGGTNLLLYTADPWQAPKDYYELTGATKTDETLNGSIVYKTCTAWTRLRMNFGKHLIDRKNVKVGDEFTYSIYVRTDQETPIKTMLFFRYSDSTSQKMTGGETITQEWQKLSFTFKVTQKMLSDSSKLSWVGWEQTTNSESGKFVYYACNKLERGNIATDYSPNEADLEQKVAEYKQNADRNYASLQTTVQNLDGTVQHNKTVADQTAQGFTTRIESLETYKDGETTRANQYFESAKTETARQLTAERTAIAKDYVAKSTYTSDVTGIRNELSATTSTANTTKTNLANYQASNDKVVASLKSSLQTTDGNVSNLQTKVEAVPGQITSAVSAVEGKIPTSSGGRNLAQGTSKDWSKPFTNFKGTENTCPSLYKVLTDGLSVGDTIKTRIVLKYTDIVPASGKTAEIWMHGPGNVTGWGSGIYPSGGGGRRSLSGSGETVFELTDKINADHLKNSYWDLAFRTDWIASGSLQWKLAKVERGMFFTDWSPAPEDTASQISNLSSEIKQTTDAIKASVSSLDSSTVKSSSLTINADGIVMKAGKSTTDVANAIGSYFAVNQNAINLFSDKINVKGSMIVDGAITGDKIKANSVDVSKIVGIDANFIKSKIEYAMIDWLKGKTITAYNDNMTIDLQDGRISFKDGSNAVYRQTPDGIHTGFLHFEAGSQGGVYAAFGATSTRQGINSKSSEFAGIRCYRVSANGDSHEAKIDKIEVIGDTIQFGHGYISDRDIGGGFIMQAAELGSDIYSLNRVVKSIESLWRILHDHAKNTGYRFNDPAFINALNNEYNAWHDMRNQ